jgi:PIN domain
MQHVVIDTSIYRRDPKRDGTSFRALTRLSSARKVQIHVPYYVKKEFVTQQYSLLEKDIRGIQTQANKILRKTHHTKFAKYATATQRDASAIVTKMMAWADEEFGEWLKQCHAIEHPVEPEHGLRVTDDYFSGAPPFTSVKHRGDIPDSFIWQTILDLEQKHRPLCVIAEDGALCGAAGQRPYISAYKSLEEFIQTPGLQAALKGLTDKTVATNVERSTALLQTQNQRLADSLEHTIVKALSGRTVHHDSIPDDNNSAMIISVDAPKDLVFDFMNIEYYGENEIGVSFEASAECILSYSIFKADYYVMSDEKAKHISTGECNEHYFDAEEYYTIAVTGALTIALDKEKLERGDLTDDDITDLIYDADYNVEIFEASVSDF